MKRIAIIVFAILGGIMFGFLNDGKLKFKGNLQNTYTITRQNQVGTDEDFATLNGETATPYRTETSPAISGDVIYVAKNGSDSGSGDLAYPYLTVQKAVAESSTGDVVRIIRNGYSGDLTFAEQHIVVTSGDITIEVGSGDTATIQPAETHLCGIDWNQSNMEEDYTDAWYDFAVLSSGRIVVAGEVGIWYSDDDGVDWVVSGKSTGTWKALAVLSTGRIIAGSSSGLWYSDDNGVNWTQSNKTNGDWRSLVVLSTGRIVAGSASNGIWYSDDNGVNWSQSLKTTDGWASLVILSSGRIIAGSYTVGLWYSDNNGVNWTQSNKTDGNWRSLVLLSTGRIVGGNASYGIWYSDDNGVNWAESNKTNEGWQALAVLYSGRIVASCTANGIWYSDDNGVNWTQSDKTDYTFYSLAITSTGRAVAGCDTYGIWYSSFCQIADLTFTSKLSGLIFDGENKITGFTNLNNVQFCNIKNVGYGVYSTSGDINVSNSIFHGNEYHIECENADIQESLFYDAEETAVIINTPDSDTVFEHNTIDVADIGILFEAQLTTPSKVKNNIISNCATYDISQQGSTVKELSNTLITGSLYGAKIDDTSKKAKPLFKNTTDGNYEIMAVEEQASNGEYYIFNSPAKQLADDNDGGGTPYTYDAGCYLITRALASSTYGIDSIIEYFPDTFRFSALNKQMQTYENLLSQPLRHIEKQSRKFGFTWNDNSTSDNEQLYKLIEIISSDDPLKVYLNNDKALISGSGTFDFSALTFQDTAKSFFKNQWKGFWIEIDIDDDSSYAYEFYVSTHDAGSMLNLLNKNEYESLSDGTYSYRVRYIKMVCLNTELNTEQPIFSGLPDDDFDVMPFMSYELEFEEYSYD